MQSLGSYMRMSEGPAFEHSLKGLTVLFRKGYTCVFMTCVDLMRKMMNYFTALSKKLEVLLALVHRLTNLVPTNC